MADLDRTKMTFEQAEGLEPLPTQLKPQELTQALRALLWDVLNAELDRVTASTNSIVYSPAVQEPWRTILRDTHVLRYHQPADEFDARPGVQKSVLKEIIWRGNYAEVYGLLQFIVRHRICPKNFSREIALALHHCRAGYRLDEVSKTLFPIASEEEAEGVVRAFAALNTTTFSGARAHLAAAAQRLSSGDHAGGVREAMQAVESVARVIAGKRSFADALKVLERRWSFHSALQGAFSRLYGYTSDEKGIRHPMLDESSAAVDEQDALFMFGACAAFVTYLVGKAKGTTAKPN